MDTDDDGSRGGPFIWESDVEPVRSAEPLQTSVEAARPSKAQGILSSDALSNKNRALLAFLRDAATLRRKRIPAYTATDTIMWFSDVPGDRSECRSAFQPNNPDEFPDMWLEVRKSRTPLRPAVPEVVRDWVRPQDLDQSDRAPDLSPEITILIDRRIPDPEAPDDRTRTVIEKSPEVRRLKDHPEVEDAWLEYLVNQWDPWAQETRSWEEVQQVYERVDFMRRRLEEAEERYELVLAVGLLQWRDPTGLTVKRHLLTAPAEISLEAARGVLTVSPAAAFERFRVEMDMLERQNQPRIEGAGLDERLEDLDVQAWDKAKVGEILQIIANTARSDAQVDVNGFKALDRADETFRITYVPALVLRERRPAAYEELLDRFLKACDDQSSFTTTQPWERFVLEGEVLENPVDGAAERELGCTNAQSRIYFPLPRNEEQQKIIERLQARPYVLVKGPPGTGKSHTIANLICHLLATGERVLVTAHAPKALTVLREKLPGEIRSLCVTALSSTREDQRLLKDSVREILSRKNSWEGRASAQREIDKLEQELSQLEGECARVDRQLRECREAETYPHTRGSYQGTAAQIARQLEHDREAYGWFPELSDGDSVFPLAPAELQFLADFYGSLTNDQLNELGLDLPELDLPDPATFEEALKTLMRAEQEAESARRGLSPEDLDALSSISDVELETCIGFLTELELCAVRSGRVLGDVTREILRDLLVGRTEQWRRLAEDMGKSLEPIKAASERIATARVQLLANSADLALLSDARRRLDHFQNGGRRGWKLLAPRVVRETRYVEDRTRVNDQRPERAELLEMLVTFLELKNLLQQLFQLWPTASAFDLSDPKRGAREALDLTHELKYVIELFGRPASKSLSIVPIGTRLSLAEPDHRQKWLCLVRAQIASRRADRAKELLSARLAALNGFSVNKAHPCVQQLAEAIEQRDVASWRMAWATREDLKTRKQRLGRYQAMADRLENECAALGQLLVSNWDAPAWKQRLADLGRAWSWSAARAWLCRVSSGDTHRRLARERHRLQEKLERKVEELAALKAWEAFFNRLDDRTQQNLTAWTRADARIGRDTGKYAYRHRRAARQYMMACIPKIPAWIMPLHRLWQTTDPNAGVFDTVIIDEASQAGIESLLLPLLAKRMIVVGDDKQNTPEAVGVLEDDIARLARDHLGAFRFRDEFRPDTSLFDHAERAFGGPISLREHFRCVPEIIRFSNDLCYTDAPLVPLRQAPPNRLPPLRGSFVDTGSCQGEGQRIVNYAEAEVIAKTIRECLDSEAYEGKTMGVIVLQGHAQAEVIEKKLAEVLEPKAREERKIRCGVPATFQGDERDIIFLSLVIAPDHRSRALTGLNDQRRFNVAMSRARDQAWLFHSVQAHDLSPDDLRWKLLNYFQSAGRSTFKQAYEELERLEREARSALRRPGSQPDPYESWFEVDVALELLHRKYRVRPQWDVAGYYIDVVVEGMENRLAVECDGDIWHGPERWEHDMARQRQLERAGWTFERVRESEFYADRRRALEQVFQACEQLNIWPADAQGRAVAASTQEAVQQEDAPAPGGVGLANDGAVAEQQDAETESESELPPENSTLTGPFSGYSKECRFPDPREASPANVRAALRQIIERDGPLARESICRLYVEGCPGLQRVGKASRQALNRALGAMLRSEEIAQEDELGGSTPEGVVVRLAGAPTVRERPAGRRDLLEIPPLELFLLIGRLCASFLEVQNDEALARAVLDHYGFTRLTERRRQYFAKVLKAWRARREVFNESAQQKHPPSLPLFPGQTLSKS
jgi:very-short-patch-repair endonuclease